MQQMKASTSLVTAEGNTPLHMAVISNRAGVCVFLSVCLLVYVLGCLDRYFLGSFEQVVTKLADSNSTRVASKTQVAANFARATHVSMQACEHPVVIHTGMHREALHEPLTRARKHDEAKRLQPFYIHAVSEDFFLGEEECGEGDGGWIYRRLTGIAQGLA
jgi:hypothetical protein